jgi:putative redox protein
MQTDDKVQQAENASVNLENGTYFVGDIDGFRVDTDADEAFGGAGGGPQPLRFLLFGMVGCTAMDVISILRKKRQRVSGLKVEARGSRVDEHPKVYEAIEVNYRVRDKGIDPRASRGPSSSRRPATARLSPWSARRPVSTAGTR